MARSEPIGESHVARHGGALVGNDNALVRAVARMPWRVRSKLLLAFVGIVAMFVVVGILGLRTLSQSNARVERLGTLQLRAAAYRELQTGARNCDSSSRYGLAATSRSTSADRNQRHRHELTGRSSTKRSRRPC